MSPDGFRDETRYRYEGRWLVEVQGSNVTEHYRHDAQGRVVERQVDLHPENGVVTKTFRYQYTYAGNQSAAGSGDVAGWKRGASCHAAGA